MSTNPPSFRIAWESQIAKLPPEHQTVIRSQMNAFTDLYQAVTALNTKVEGVKSSAASTAAATENVTANSETVIIQPGSLSPSIGAVNNQTGATSYSTLPLDYGSEIVLNAGSPIAITLNTLGSGASIQLPWFCSFNNTGTSTATLTPSSGTINGAGSLSLLGGNFCIVYYDGTNFTAEEPATLGSGVTQITAGTAIGVSPGGGTGNVTVSNNGVTQIVAGLNVTVSPSGGTGVVTVNSTGGGAGVTQILAGTDIAISPGSWVGAVTINRAPFSCTRTDKTGTYLSGVTYTNSSGGAVTEEVEMLASGSGTGADSVLAYTVDGVSHFGNGVWNQCSGHAQVSFWVPNGSTFSATATYIDGGTTPTINKWTEVSF